MNDQIYTFYRLTSLEKTLLLSENNNEDVTDEYYDKTNVIKITEKYDDRLYRDTSDITASCDENTKNVQFNKLEKTKLNKVNISDLKNKNMIISISIVFFLIFIGLIVTIQRENSRDLDFSETITSISQDVDVNTTNVSSSSVSDTSAVSMRSFSSRIISSSDSNVNSTKSNSSISSSSTPKTTQSNNVKTKTNEQILKEAKELIPYYENRWYIKQLSGKQLENLCAMYKSCINGEYECDLPHPMSEYEIYILRFYLNYDCPEIITDVWENEETSSNIISTTYFSDINSNTSKQREASEAVINELCSRLVGYNDYEKERYIYQYFAEHCVYDSTTNNKNTPYGVLVDGRANREGVARAFKWLMDKMGIQSMCIYGIDTSDQYSVWNSVRINDIYYDTFVNRYSDSNEFSYRMFNVPCDLLHNEYNYPDAQIRYTLPTDNLWTGTYYYCENWFIDSNSDYNEKLNEFFDRSFSNIENNNGIYSGTFEFQVQDSITYEIVSQNIDTFFNSWVNSKANGIDSKAISKELNDDGTHIITVTYSFNGTLIQ